MMSEEERAHIDGFTEHDDNTPEEAAEIKIAKETVKHRQARMKAAWDHVLSSPEGRAVVWDIIGGRLGVMRAGYSTNMQPHDIIAASAVQSEGAALVGFLIKDYPARFKQMLQENLV